jgi:hypothetical protein
MAENVVWRGDQIQRQREAEQEAERKRISAAAAAAERTQRNLRDTYRKKRIALLSTLAKRIRSTKHYYGGKKDDRWDAILRRKDLHLLAFSMTGLIVSVIMSYLKWDQRCWVRPDDPTVCSPAFESVANATLVTATFENTRDYYPVMWFFITAGQAILSGSTLVCFILILQLYGLREREQRREWSGVSEVDLIEAGGNGAESDALAALFTTAYQLRSSSMKWWMAAELLLHLIHPLAPLENVTDAFSTFYEVTESFIFLRLYLALRCLYSHSEIYRLRFDIVSSNRELQRLGYQITATSTFKIVFYKYTTAMVLLLTTLSILVFGFWIFVTERNNNEEFASLWNSFWFVWETTATVGYGDMAAVTITGRLIVIVVSLNSFIILSLFSGVVANLVAPTREQKYVAAYAEQKEADDEFNNAAQNVIRCAWLEYKARRAQRWWVDAGTGQRRSPRLYGAMKRFRAARLGARNALGSAADPVIDAKLQRSIVLAYRLNTLLDDQMTQLAAVEKQLTESCALIKKRLTQRRGTGMSTASRTALGVLDGTLDASRRRETQSPAIQQQKRGPSV